jgi:hypothetical protein
MGYRYARFGLFGQGRAAGGGSVACAVPSANVGQRYEIYRVFRVSSEDAGVRKLTPA